MIKVGISNRHVHLNRSALNTLFGENYELKNKRDLTQIGEYACEETVDLETEFGRIEHVRVIGPIREYTQVELLESDKSILNITPPKRDSGDLKNSESITLIGTVGKIYLESSVIIANRHIHMNEQDTINYEVQNGDIVSVKKGNIIIDNVHVKVNPNFILEIHLDKDDELKYNIHTNDEVEIIH